MRLFLSADSVDIHVNNRTWFAATSDTCYETM